LVQVTPGVETLADAMPAAVVKTIARANFLSIESSKSQLDTS
jgi:hypothetical protein